ncbi:MAG: serine protease, partial [Desulfuromonadales bacterium]|nr:serine protease [Desulfuromonadales bacterium]NIS43099.1 serine protease [Desulfuromonadales bacterium]
MADKSKSVSLVLGSGGARGLAHIGIIRYLEEQNYKIESVSGC